jgi:hypothetical protein
VVSKLNGTISPYFPTYNGVIQGDTCLLCCLHAIDDGLEMLIKEKTSRCHKCSISYPSR